MRPTAGYLDTQAAAVVPFRFVKQDRNSYYAATHLQTILFQITQKIIEDLLAPSTASNNKKTRVMRLQSRHQLFPQVFSFVQAFVAKRVKLNGIDARELGLDKYATLIVERLRDAIHPDASAGRTPLLPGSSNRYRPVGKTTSVDFPTTRPVASTTKSHINLVVQHSDWEAQAAQALDACDFVKCYARNDHLGLVIPYEFMGTERSYEPDFLVRLLIELNLLLEIKGYEVHNPELNNAKHGAAKRWVEAVNNLGEFGQWDFLVVRDMADLLPELAKLAARRDTTAVRRQRERVEMMIVLLIQSAKQNGTDSISRDELTLGLAFVFNDAARKSLNGEALSSQESQQLDDLPEFVVGLNELVSRLGIAGYLSIREHEGLQLYAAGTAAPREKAPAAEQQLAHAALKAVSGMTPNDRIAWKQKLYAYPQSV